jgi:hypothetical protein
MSRPYQHPYPQSEPSLEPMVWQRVEWQQGDGRYVFEVGQGGLHATLASPHGAKLTLPMVAWEGLLDALSAARKARQRSEGGHPARSGARWYAGEAGELASAFRAGRSIKQLAHAHHRSEFAVEAELDRQGLWDRVERRLKQASGPTEQADAADGTRASPHGLDEISLARNKD